MADEKERVTTPVGTLCFPHLFEKHVAGAGAEPRFEAMVVFDEGADLSDLSRIAKAAVAAKFPSGRPDDLHSPFVKGEKKEKYGEPFTKGRICVTARTKFQPGMVDGNLQPIINEQDMYPGCRVRLQVHAYGYDTKGNRGISFGLDNVQKVGEGTPLGGRARPEEAFEPVAGTSNQPAAADADDLLG